MRCWRGRSTPRTSGSGYVSDAKIEMPSAEVVAMVLGQAEPDNAVLRAEMDKHREDLCRARARWWTSLVCEVMSRDELIKLQNVSRIYGGYIDADVPILQLGTSVLIKLPSGYIGSTQFNGWFKLSCNWWMTLCDAYPGLDDELDAGFTGAEGWTPPDLSDLNLELDW